MNRSITIFCTLLFLAYALASFFSFPSFDDYIHAAALNDISVWEYQSFFYFSWGGRFTSNLFMTFPVLLDPTWNYYGVWVLTLIALGYVSLWYFSKTLFLNNHYALSVLFFALLTTGVPSITELFYWVTGAISYSIGIFATLIGIAILVNRERRPRAFHDYLLLFLTILIVGNNEMTLICWQQLLLSFLIYKKIKYGKWDRDLLFIIIIGSIAGLIALFAPGNFVRQSHFEKSGRIFRTISNGVLHYFLFSIKLLSLPIIIAGIRFRKEIISKVDELFKDLDLKNIRKLIWAHWFLLLFTTTALAFWAMGRKPNSRSLNVVAFYYWLSLPFIMWLFQKYFKDNRFFLFVDRRWVPVLAIAFLLTFNVQKLIKDLFIFPGYYQEWTERLDEIKHGKGKHVYIYPLTKKTNTTYFNDLYPRDTNQLKSIFGFKSLKFVTKEEFQQRHNL